MLVIFLDTSSCELDGKIGPYLQEAVQQAAMAAQAYAPWEHEIHTDHYVLSNIDGQALRSITGSIDLEARAKNPFIPPDAEARREPGVGNTVYLLSIDFVQYDHNNAGHEATIADVGGRKRRIMLDTWLKWEKA